MMGLFIMAALMGFQSIPISQAVSNEMTQSFTDLSRVAETKSYGDLYYFNFVPNGAEHSVNNMSHKLGKEGGAVDWDYGEFSPDNEIETDVELKTQEIVDKMITRSRTYFNDNYAGVSTSGVCGMPPINYSIGSFPDSDGTMLQKVKNNEDKLPLVVRSQVEVDYSGYTFFPDIEAAPMEVECAFEQGNTKYIGDTENNEESNGGGNPIFGGLPGWYGNWQSPGFTKQLQSDANRYHVMANRTAYIYKKVHDNWVSDVQTTSNTNEDVCDPTDSDWEQVESNTVGDVGSDVNQAFNDVVDGEVDVEGLSGEFELRPYLLELDYDDYTRNYYGEASYSTSNVHGCDCHEDHSEDSDGTHCHETEKDLTVTVTPNVSVMRSNITDDKYRVNTEEGWKHLEFNVEAYNHDFQNDDSEE